MSEIINLPAKNHELTPREVVRELDRYMQDCIRYIVAGNHGKKRYNLRYATLQAWGYRPLVHEYYAQRRESAGESADKS